MSTRRFSFVQSLHIVFALGWADFLLKYRGSTFGYLWSFVGPLFRFLVILYVFGPYVRPSIPLYPLYLFLGMIIWEYFTNTTNGCMRMLTEKSGIVQRHPFPRILLILAVGWTNIIIFATHLVIFAVFAWFLGASLHWNIIYLPLIALQMTFVALGVGMILAAYCLKYRDIKHLWEILVQILFWLTPIMYPYRVRTAVTASILAFLRHPGLHIMSTLSDIFIHFQPLAIIINDARRVTLYPVAAGSPTFLHAIGMTLFCALFFLVGKLIFDRRVPYFNQEY